MSGDALGGAEAMFGDMGTGLGKSADAGDAAARVGAAAKYFTVHYEPGEEIGAQLAREFLAAAVAVRLPQRHINSANQPTDVDVDR